MKGITFIFCLLIIGIQTTSATPPFNNNQEATVVAPSGLSLRLEPGTEAKAIYTIEFGETVTVLNNETTACLADRYEWMDGSWIKVEYAGMEGYVFDGFLSTLPLPFHEGEFCIEELDFITPVENWFENNFDLARTPDTLLRSDGSAKVLYASEQGHRMIKHNYENYYKLDIYMSNQRIMDCYNLLLSMTTNKVDREVLARASTFIEDNQDKLTLVKIGIDNQIRIKRLENDQIKISLYSPHEGCTI